MPRRGAWLNFLCRRLSCSLPFRALLDSALSPALETVGLSTQAVALDSVDGDIRYEADGSARAAVYLTGPDAIAVRAEIGWRCTSHPGERVMPSVMDWGQRGCTLGAFWSRFPKDVLVARYGRPFDISGVERFSFAVEVWPLSWPHVFLELEYADAVTDEALATESTLAARFQSSNAQRNQGNIHNMSNAERLDGHHAEISVDFGSTGPDAIVGLLDTLNEAERQVSLKKVVIRGYSLYPRDSDP